ncbi:MAG: hydrogenase maturation protein [Bacteroidetes bacterium]|nr:hydrogenase maturation protein [Bacteroidota bacterium]
MKILFLTTAHNGLSQRACMELMERGHAVQVQLATTDKAMEAAVVNFEPQLIIAPFLKKAVPASIWQHHTVLIVHPGIMGDRGPSSLDWAIMQDRQEWGVTILQAAEEMDAGDIWAAPTFPMRLVSKSTLYRHEVTQAAIEGLLEAVEKFENGAFVPEPLDYRNPQVKGRLHIHIKTSDRSIDWRDTTANILRKIRAADSTPGVLDKIYEENYRLFGAHEEGILTGVPGTILATRDGAICRATGDGAVWISHLKKEKGGIKLPATLVLGDKLKGVTESSLCPFEHYHNQPTFREIWYEEADSVGYLHFNIYNGAMSTSQCQRLRQSVARAKARKTKVLVLMGGHDIWSNGIHLNVIEQAADPGQESWENINAMNDLVREIILTDSKLVIAAMQGNAGAGGAILALAADRVWSRTGIVLNPHYKKMGGLYGSEYWTYLLPKRVGQEHALRLTEACQPLSTGRAQALGFLDRHFGETGEAFCRQVRKEAKLLAESSEYDSLLAQKSRDRAADELVKPLEKYRDEELRHMHANFFGDDPSYHLARFHFVHKIACAQQPAKEAVVKYAPAEMEQEFLQIL